MKSFTRVISYNSRGKMRDHVSSWIGNNAQLPLINILFHKRTVIPLLNWLSSDIPSGEEEPQREGFGAA